MTDTLIRCNKCGHLLVTSPCHNCSNEIDYTGEYNRFPVEDANKHSVEYFNHFYTARSAGYGKIQFIGVLLVAISPIVFTLSVVANIYFLLVGNLNSVVLGMGLFALTTPVVGFSLTKVSGQILADNEVGLKMKLKNLAVYFVAFMIMATVLMIFIGILLAIPVINIIVALILTGIILSLLRKFPARCLGYIQTWLGYIQRTFRHPRRWGVDRFTAVSTVIKRSDSDPESSSVFLKLLLMLPPSEITKAQRNFVTEHLEENPLVASQVDVRHNDSLFDLLRATYSTSDKNQSKLVELMFESGRQARLDRQFMEAKICFEAVDQLVDDYDLNSYQQKVEDEKIVTESLRLVSSVVSDERLAQLSANARPEEFAEPLLDASRQYRSSRNFEEAESCVEAVDQISDNHDLKSYQQRIEHEKSVMESLRVVDSFVSDEQIIRRLSANDRPEEFVETLLDASRQYRSNRRLEESENCLEAVDRINDNYDLKSYQQKIEYEKSVMESLRVADSFVSNEQLIRRLSANNRPAEFIETLLDAGRQHRSNNQFEEARDYFQGTAKIDNKLTNGEFGDVIAAEINDTDNRERVFEFETEVNELYDITRSAEGAFDASQYQKALRRFRSVSERLPEHLSGEGATQESYRELVDRVRDGLAAAGRQRLLMLLPGSPSPFERELITIGVPYSIANRIQSIYEGTLDENVYRTITTDTMLNQVSMVTNRIETYRECRERIVGAVNDTQSYLDRLDSIIQTELYTAPILGKRLYEAVFRASEVTESIAYQPRKAETSELGQIDANKFSVEVLESALRTGIAFSQTLADIDRINKKDLDSSVELCLQAVRNSLLNRDSLRSQASLEEVTDFVNRVAEVELYTDALSSMAVGSIVDEITLAIDNGTTINKRSFEDEFERIERLVAREVDSVANEIEAFLSEWENHPAVDTRAWQSAISEARTQTDPQLLVEPYSKIQEMQGAMWKKEALHQFSWREFEQLISNLYEQQGYDTTVTPGSNDAGVDLWAEDNAERVAIQVKQFSDGNTVGRPVIQKLESTLARDNADQIVIITSSTFANTAQQYAADSRDVQLINGDKLITQLTRFDVPSPA